MNNSLIEIHMIQNHCPANLNRDDLGAPKSCFFGGVLRSRISSQCIKRSIRMSDDFGDVLGGIRTRRLAELIQKSVQGTDIKKKAKEILSKLGVKSGKVNAGSDMLVYTTTDAIVQMADLISNDALTVQDLLEPIAEIISTKVHVPDMALCGRMLETGEIKNTTVEAALQVAHAISTHEAHPEIDYFVAVDDVKGEDAGAGYIDEAMYASACFYKYFSIDCRQLLHNLAGNEALSAKTIGAFILSAARTNPSGKQNSYAAHNYPEGILVEIKQRPFNYSNAFIKPVEYVKGTDIVSASIGQLSEYLRDISIGYYSKDSDRSMFWFSPNKRHPLEALEEGKDYTHHGVLEEFVYAILKKNGHNWDDVKNIKAHGE
ncbi:MAG: type I-E CRISPR-associated protein Cas7/Cse4/CasC [Eubacteriales bacterium]|nr:type I-E CRISPR-associated protein Cas7/Cse4/CasC [Eubacteriales bacterium]MDD4686527.1 type I-E CRISPR-associated protein Cas7/Cse4/CasC [Candidatus Cloacimonadota bacterium]